MNTDSEKLEKIDRIREFFIDELEIARRCNQRIKEDNEGIIRACGEKTRDKLFFTNGGRILAYENALEFIQAIKDD